MERLLCGRICSGKSTRGLFPFGDPEDKDDSSRA
jgi:hypothetical protein